MKTLLSLLAFIAHEESLLFEILMEEDDIDKDQEEPMKMSRRIYDRPDYRKSLWWTMLEKGDCKDPSNRIPLEINVSHYHRWYSSATCK